MKKIKNILIASDSFKGSLSSEKVGNAIKSGFLEVDENLNIEILPIADGGEGTVEAIIKAVNGKMKLYKVTGPFGKETEAHIGIIEEGIGVIESADPVGLHKLKENELDPFKACSYGLGELIKFALDLKLKKLYIGLGGSATNDGGVGMAKALGVKILDKNNNPVKNGAEGLKDVAKIDMTEIDTRLKEIEIIILSDVKNPLTGKEGATYIFGPQKGVKESDLKKIDDAMKNYAKVLDETFGKNISKLEGAGAAGGLGAALLSYVDGHMSSGIETILDLIGIEKNIEKSDLVVTGEGKMDGQSIYGKAPLGIANLAKSHGKKTIAIVGSTGNDVEKVLDSGLYAVFDIVSSPMELSYAMENAEELVKHTAKMALKTINNLLN